jgi:stage V sporulation protein S
MNEIRKDQNIIVRSSAMDMIKVSATSRTSAVAGAIAGVVREHHRAEVQAIGAGAINQAVKALVLATGYLKSDGIFVSCVPEFADVTIDDKVRTAIKLVIEPSANSDFSLVNSPTYSVRKENISV